MGGGKAWPYKREKLAFFGTPLKGPQQCFLCSLGTVIHVFAVTSVPIFFFFFGEIKKNLWRVAVLLFYFFPLFVRGKVSKMERWGPLLVLRTGQVPLLLTRSSNGFLITLLPVRRADAPFVHAL